jgi:FkbM family methyltransferase
MPFAAQRFPDPIKRRIRDALGLIGLEVIPKRSNQWLSQTNIQTVIDVGANRGQFARVARALFPDSRIYSFEPLDDCYRELVRSFSADPKFQAFNVAIGAQAATMTMHRNQFDASSSMLPMTEVMPHDFPFLKSTSEVTVRVQRLDDACRGLALEPEILVKIDVQGYEDRVIAGAQELLGRTKLVLAEVSFEALYAGQPLFQSIYEQLAALGFGYRGNWEQIVSPRDGRVLQADAIFLKS